MDKRCPKCGIEKPITDFFKNPVYCKPCSKLYAQSRPQEIKQISRNKSNLWKIRNKEKVAVYMNCYWKENKSRILLRNKQSGQDGAWARKNPELRKKYVKLWAIQNPGLTRAAKAKRRAAESFATPSWANRSAIAEVYVAAAAAEEIFGVKFHVDHIIPLQSRFVCGLHVENNLQILPAKVNLSKSNRFQQDAMAGAPGRG